MCWIFCNENEINTSLSPQDHNKPDRQSTIKYQFFNYLNNNSSVDGNNGQKYDLLNQAFLYFNTPPTAFNSKGTIGFFYRGC